jgi:uncharacterized protein YifN (PemK superfamily)
MRKRISENKFKTGDLFKADLPGTKIKHICIILEDEPMNGHIKCLPVCNFTSKSGSIDDYSIDISHYNLPEEWFDNKQPESWIRCNALSCVFMTNFSKNDRLGNLEESFPELWKEVCNAVFNCPISDRLQNLCDCEYEEISHKIDMGLIAQPDCGCN